MSCEITYLTRGKRHGTFEVIFKTVDQAKYKSSQDLKADERLLSPLYIEKRTLKIRISGVPPEVSVEKLMAAITFGEREKMIIDADVLEEAFWISRKEPSPFSWKWKPSNRS